MAGGHIQWSTGPRPKRACACATAHPAHSSSASPGSSAARSPSKRRTALTTPSSTGPAETTPTSPVANHRARQSLATGGASTNAGGAGGGTSSVPGSAAPVEPAARGGGGSRGLARTVQTSTAISSLMERSGVTPLRPAVIAAERGWATLTHTGCVKRELTASPGPCITRAPPAATAATNRSPG